MCCDPQMVQIMEDNFKMFMLVFGRCPTCVKNFQKSICALNCSPKHNRFLTPYTAEKEDDDKIGTYFTLVHTKFLSRLK